MPKNTNSCDTVPLGGRIKLQMKSKYIYMLECEGILMNCLPRPAAGCPPYIIKPEFICWIQLFKYLICFYSRLLKGTVSRDGKECRSFLKNESPPRGLKSFFIKGPMHNLHFIFLQIACIFQIVMFFHSTQFGTRPLYFF